MPVIQHHGTPPFLPLRSCRGQHAASNASKKKLGQTGFSSYFCFAADGACLSAYRHLPAAAARMPPRQHYHERDHDAAMPAAMPITLEQGRAQLADITAFPARI